MKPIAKNAVSAFAGLAMATAFFCTPLLASSSLAQASETQPEAQSSVQGTDSNGESAGAAQSTTGFHVSARIPDNQTDKNLSYFSLLMAPSQQQVLEVEIRNEGSEEITVDVSAVSASTNPNGIIDYKTPDIEDDTLNLPFASIAEVQEESIQVPAGGTGVAAIQVTMPSAEFDGAVLGGLVFTKRPLEVEMDETENGAMIQNVYSYALGVALKENQNAVTPDFELLGVDANLFDNQPSFIHSIRNQEAFIVKGMQVTASVYEGDDTQGTPVATRTQELVDMAPNSVLEFSVQPEDGTLEGGTYTSEVVLQLDGDEWRYTTSFRLQNDEATLINDTAPFAPAPTQAQQNGPNTALVVVIIALLAVIAVLAVVLLSRRGRRRG